jgi:hypothetical protein
MATSLYVESSRRNPAADDGGQHDGDIELRFLIVSGPTAGHTPGQEYGRDSVDPADQAFHDAFQRLTQCTLHNKFHNNNDCSTYGRCLKK